MYQTNIRLNTISQTSVTYNGTARYQIRQSVDKINSFKSADDYNLLIVLSSQAPSGILRVL